MIAGIIFRLLAVVFARGWGMIDDHFLAVESAQSWVDGYDYNSWLPGSPGNTGPTGHNFFYPGLHFLLFLFFKFIHLTNPQMKMFFVRLINASWSLIIIYFGYKITERLCDKRSARIVGLLLALLWFMPWVSVRDLVEMSCVPLLIMAVWFIVSRGDQPGQTSAYFLSGLFLGLSFDLRPQTIFFSFGLILVVLYERKWKETITLILGSLIPVVLVQGTVDYFIWGKPFVELIGYIKGNILSAKNYITLPWYNYFLVIFGIWFLRSVSCFFLVSSEPGESTFLFSFLWPYFSFSILIFQINRKGLFFQSFLSSSSQVLSVGMSSLIVPGSGWNMQDYSAVSGSFSR